MSTEVRRYLHNVVTFLRNHRAVARGVTPGATKHFEILVKTLALLHGLTFVPPSLIALAARKVYRHRVVIVEAEDERSLQYGSDVDAVAALLDGLAADDIIEDVLASVEAPL
jgi:MoxR-like ATPase